VSANRDKAAYALPAAAAAVCAAVGKVTDQHVLTALVTSGEPCAGKIESLRACVDELNYRLTLLEECAEEFASPESVSSVLAGAFGKRGAVR